jgi:pimeloyl-ACP methyl ester carboxylesterase
LSTDQGGFAWRFQISALAPHYRVIAPDLREYGETDKPSKGYDAIECQFGTDRSLHGFVGLGYGPSGASPTKSERCDGNRALAAAWICRS